MYKKWVWDAGDYQVVKKGHSGRYPGKSRGKKEKQTSAAVQTYNRKLRREKVQLLIMANFAPGDLYVTLTYRKDRERPASLEEAKKCLSVFLRKLKAWYRKKGMEMKWIGVAERGSKGACHHHIILNRVPGLHDMIDELWTWGHPQVVRLYEEGAFEKLAEYIIKAEGKNREDPGSRYSRSRNLLMPQPKEEVISAVSFTSDPKPVKGYYLIKETVENGENPLNGHRYQRYVMKKTSTDRSTIT